MNNTSATNQFEANESVRLSKDALTTIAMIATVSGYLLANSYLNSVSLAKECLLLHLYREVGRIVLWVRSIWMIEVILSNWDWLSKLKAIIVSIGVHSGALYLAIIMNTISCLKLYMLKKGVIDPPIPWMGENEKSAMNRIRMICGLIIVIFLFTCFGIGIYPNIYYSCLNDPLIQSDWMSNVTFRICSIKCNIFIGEVNQYTNCRC